MSESTTQYLNKAVLNFAGVTNARTYRQVRCTAGRMLKANMLIRSSRLSAASTADLTRMAALGVTGVIDLRLPAEVAAHPDRSIAGADYLHAPIPSDRISTIAPTVPELFTYFKEHADGSVTKQAAYRRVVADPELQASVRAGVELALDTPGGVLVHCSLGKDRTGVFTAVFLDALGVSRQFIINDYMMSTLALRAHAQQVAAQFAQMGATPRMQKSLATLSGVHSRYIQGVFAWIDAHYGSSAAYFAQGLGFGARGVRALQAKFLDPAAD